jgi:flagellin
MSDRILLNSAFTNNLLAIRQAERTVDTISARLASGLKVNNALDDPQNYFAARALKFEGADLNRLLDGIGTGIRTIQEAIKGVEGVNRLLDQGETVVMQVLEDFRAGNIAPAPAPVPTVPPLSTQILADGPVGYWRLNETAGATAANLGSVGAAGNAAYQNAPTLGSAAMYGDGDVSTAFDGTNDRVSIPNNAQFNTSTYQRRSVELVFNADTVAGRHVLYEEGGGTNAFSIYVDNGRVYVNGRDSGAWGPVNISAPIVAGQTYHVGFTFDFPNSIFRGYVDGVEIGNAPVNAIFPSHTGNIGIGWMNNATWYHDGSQGGNGNYFDGRISDVAIYNTVLTAQQMTDHAASVAGVTAIPPAQNEEFNKILDQITQLVTDAHYRGIHLLKGDDLITYFNNQNTHTLKTAGVDFTAQGLGIKYTGFDSETQLEDILVSIREARARVRGYGNTLVNNLNVIKVREEFTRNTITNMLAGAQDLIKADENEEGANMLAAQTRLQLATTSLSIASTINASVLNLVA